jgi:lauroyl/myristoyl acyltransferase
VTKIAKAYRRYLAGMRMSALLRPHELKYAAAYAWTTLASPRIFEKTLVQSQMQSCAPHLSKEVATAWRDYLWHASANTLNTYLYPAMISAWLGSVYEVRGAENLRTAQHKGSGVLVLSAHQHSLMLIAVAIGLLQLPVHAILMNPRLTAPDFLEVYAEQALRGSTAHFNGGEYIFVDYGGAFVRPVYRAFQAGSVVLSANDFPASLAPKRRQVLPFLGRKISCPTGSVEIAIQSAAAIVPCFVRRERGRLLIEFYPGLHGNTQQIMVEYGQLLEATVRADPGGWEGWKWPDVFDVT